MIRAAAPKRLGLALGASMALHLLALGSLLQWPGLLHREAPPPEREAIVEVVMGNGAGVTGAPVPPPPAPAERPAPPAPPPRPAAPPAPAPEMPKPPEPQVQAKAAPALETPKPPEPQVEAKATPAPPQPVAPPAPEPQPEAEAPPAPPPITETLPLPPPPDLAAAVAAPSLPPVVVRPPASPPPEKSTWETRSLLGEGTVGAAEILGDRLRPAVGSQGNLPPVYPRLSSQLGEQGVVVVRMLIGADGLVGGVQVLQSSGYPRLDEAAVAAVAHWRFTPALQNGEPVGSAEVLALRFRLD